MRCLQMRISFEVGWVHRIHDADGNRIAEYDYDPLTLTSTLLREYVWIKAFDEIPKVSRIL